MRTEPLHAQETLLEQRDPHMALVEWQPTLWCGKVLYAGNNRDEPDGEKLMADFVALAEADLSPNDPEDGWNAFMNFNSLTPRRPSGIFFGLLVSGPDQPEGFDQVRLPAGRYLRIAVTEDSAQALAGAPGELGPCQWAAGLAKGMGFRVRETTLPILTYYRCREDGTLTGCWLYVPVYPDK